MGPLVFPKIEKPSAYEIVGEGGATLLEIRSDGGASGLILKESFNVFETPRLRWRWKAENIHAAGDARNKDGDDYPVRIYVIFEYDPEKARGFKKAQYALAKTLYGEYPPESA